MPLPIVELPVLEQFGRELSRGRLDFKDIFEELAEYNPELSNLLTFLAFADNSFSIPDALVMWALLKSQSEVDELNAKFGD